MDCRIKSGNDEADSRHLPRFTHRRRRLGSGKVGFLNQFFQEAASGIAVSSLQQLQPRQKVFGVIGQAAIAFKLGDDLVLLRDLAQPACDPLLDFRQALLDICPIHIRV